MRWLRFRMLTGQRRQRGRVREWLKDRPRLAELLRRTGCLDIDAQTMARGVAVGLFIGLTPTVGAQTVLIVLAAICFRASLPAAYLVSFVSNPLTMAPLYLFWHGLGERLLAWLPTGGWAAAKPRPGFADDAFAMLIGSLVIAIPVAAAGYWLALRLWRRRPKAMRPPPDEPAPPPSEVESPSGPPGGP